MATLEQIQKILDTHYAPKYSGGIGKAFERLLLDRCEGRVTDAFIRRIIDEAIAKGELQPGQPWRSAWSGFYAEAWMIEPCQANEIILLDGLAKRGRPLTAENLLGLNTNKPLIARLAKSQAWSDHQDQEARNQALWKQEGIAASNDAIEAGELESELLSPWYDENGSLRRDVDPREFTKAQDRVKALTLEQLRAEVAIKRENKRRRGLSKAELAELTRSENAPRSQVVAEVSVAPALVPVSLEEIPVPLGKVRIPSLYYPPGKNEGLSWSFRLFELLPSSERQRLIRTFGNEQIVAACRTAKAAQGAR